ncbi:MAG: S-methyl-5-thioribose-1-phosphate isomerase [Rhodothermales bacterium]
MTRSAYDFEPAGTVPPLRWGGDRVALLDQTRLPAEEVWLDLRTPEEMAEAIRMLRVRGAPAIGIAAAYGVVLGAGEPAAAIALLRTTRPTAVNLFWALDRMAAVVARHAGDEADALRGALLAEALAIHAEDLDAGRRLGEFGLTLFRDGMRVMTHCHAGGVATSGYGTALAPLLMSRSAGVRLTAVVNETRPLLQGSRITAWELQRAGVPVTLITDSMAAHAMRRGMVDAVIVGADRIAANGDTANKIGTYALAVLARAHDLPFYVSAPRSTIDPVTGDGGMIPIEERSKEEITRGFGRQTAPDGIGVFNPAFDVTPASLIAAIVTEVGILRPPFGPAIAEILAEGAVRH